jgi:maltose alpha-D-glucosyltransferase/alpha-amylase
VPDNPAVLVMRYEWRNNAVLFLHNFSDEPCEVHLETQESHGRQGLLVNLMSGDHSSADADDGTHGIQLEGYGYRWYRVGGLDYLLQRSQV